MINKKSESFKHLSNDFKEHRKDQFFSIFYQVNEILNNLNVYSVLEFGSGRGLTKTIVQHFGINYVTVDVRPGELNSPDYISSISEYQDNKKYDLVCAFQTLEHNPFDQIPELIKKMASHSSKYVYISIPFNGLFVGFSSNWRLPKFSGNIKNYIAIPRGFTAKTRPVEEYKKRQDPYSPHYWEVGDKNLGKKEFERMLNASGLKVEKRFHNEIFPYHLFYLLEKI